MKTLPYYNSDKKLDAHLEFLYENKLEALSGATWEARDGKKGTFYVTTCMTHEEAKKLKDVLANELGAKIVESRQQNGAFRVLVLGQSIAAYVDDKAKKSSFRPY